MVPLFYPIEFGEKCGTPGERPSSSNRPEIRREMQKSAATLSVLTLLNIVRVWAEEETDTG